MRAVQYNGVVNTLMHWSIDTSFLRVSLRAFRSIPVSIISIIICLVSIITSIIHIIRRTILLIILISLLAGLLRSPLWGNCEEYMIGMPTMYKNILYRRNPHENSISL